MPFCMNCGKELTTEKFCPNCGMPLDGGKPFGAQKKPKVQQGIRARDLIFKAIEVLKQKPLRLWGVSLLCQLLILLAAVFGVLPIISIPIALVLNAGMAAVYLSGYRGQEVNADALFAGFKRFFRVAGGMGWMALWILIWGMIPVAGIVFAVIKAYSYRFVPYFMIQDPDISATEALRLSVKKTEGFKGRMFLADFLVILAVYVVVAVFALLGMIPHVGVVFQIIGCLVSLAISLLLPLLLGLIHAAGYEEIFVKEGKGDAAA
ncbi:MAG: zinc ribbon domain-containing protein [Christensenella sp.]|nr:zinc ribbon domain-containing protein [Christensenella sp.]